MLFRRQSNKRHRSDTPTQSLWRHVAFGVGICFSVALLLVGVWYGTRLPLVTIEHIFVAGGETISHETVRAVVESVLNDEYLTLIPYRFSFFYPHDALVASVSAIPRVKDVTVLREDKNTIHVTFTEYVPYALWCVYDGDVQHCYFLDDTGYAFAPGPQLDGGALVRHLFEDGSPLGNVQVFELSALHDTHAFLQRLEQELSLRVIDVIYTKDGDMRLMINGGGEIRMRNDGVYDAVFDNLASVLSSDEFKHLKPGNFRYIDLRFGNKLFVNEALESETFGTTTEETATTT